MGKKKIHGVGLVKWVFYQWQKKTKNRPGLVRGAELHGSFLWGILYASKINYTLKFQYFDSSAKPSLLLWPSSDITIVCSKELGKTLILSLGLRL